MMKNKFFRFAIIGVLNTGIDLTIYTTLRTSGFNVIIANAISTTIALTFSFLMNRRYTFHAHGDELHRQVIRFVPITLLGLWFLQPILIYFFDDVSTIFHLVRIGHTIIPERVPLDVMIPKLLAVSGSLVWNYLWYHYYVFKPIMNVSSKRDEDEKIVS